MTDSIKPWLYLPLDEQVGQVVWDRSGNKRNATLEGDATIVDEATFGGCLELNGGSLTLPALEPEDIKRGVTILMWVKHASAPTGQVTGNVLSLERFGTGLSTHLYGWPKSGLTMQSPDPAPRGSVYLHFAPDSWMLIRHDEWVPLALSWGEVNGRFEVRLYGQTQQSDAVLVHELQSSTAHTLSGEVGGSPGAAPVLAHTPAAGGPRGHLSAGFQFLTPELSRGFRGSIAQLRIYPGVLDAATIALIRKGDVAPGDTGTDQGLPIDLSFENEEASPTLFIDGLSGGHAMLLRVTSRAVMHLRTTRAQASADDWHFRLSFRPGALSSLDPITVATPGFSLAKQRTDDLDTLYLLATAPIDDGAIDIELRGVVADGRQGTRLTRMQLDYKDVRRDGIDAPLRGHATQHLNLINHHGRRDVPVHVAFAGSSRVAIGRTANLRLHITNTLPDTPRPGRSNALTFGSDACLRLSFDERVGTDWALAGTEAVRAITVRWAQGTASEVSPLAAHESDDSRESRWVVPLAGITLQPLERIELLLIDVPAHGREGHSNAYVDLINNPGYWDARFACAIDKVVPQTASQWKALPLEAGWRCEAASAPEYLRDANGVVHLRGECWYEDIGRAPFKPNNPIAFYLPGEATPARYMRLYGKTHIIRSGSRPVAYGADIVHNYYMAGIWTSTPGHGIPTDENDAQDARLYLDGISFVAGQR